MYSREEIKKTKEAFWTAYGQYMRAVPFASPDRQHWVNYKTGVKHLFFRLSADHGQAQIAIVINHPDQEIRRLIFDQFVNYKTLLHQELGEEWDWQPDDRTWDHKPTATISTRLPEAYIMNKEDWPALISFFKPRQIALDAFWSDVQDAFDLFNS